MESVIISSVAFGDKTYTRLLRRTMTYLQKYHSANLPELMKIISKNGIGMDKDNSVFLQWKSDKIHNRNSKNESESDSEQD